MGAAIDDVQPVANETRDRIITGTATAVPFLALLVVAWQLWNDALRWSDLVVFFICYVATALGVTVGFHRHLTHRAFKAKRWVRGALAILGSAAIEGPVISWVADHRKHHTYADVEGDPQIRFVDRTFLLWVAVGLLVPFGLGYLIGGSLYAALTGLLWGGAVRMLVVHHVTYSINSLCHFFGRKAFDTGDESRNLLWLSPFTFGESWHNNHHAFPTSYRHGLRPWQLDISAGVIWLLERAGLAWDVVRVPPERQARKALGT
jgi:stearoyl-CoA desaturase (delta-9 desaturase)